jgi:hypothetical protein
MNEIKVWSSGGIIWTRKIKVVEEKTVPVPLSPPQIQCSVAGEPTQVSLGTEQLLPP